MVYLLSINIIMHKLLSIVAVLCVLCSSTMAETWPSVIRTSASIVCDTEDQATEILEMYQSGGAAAAMQVLKRLMHEKNQYNDSKCVVTAGVYVILEEKLRLVIQEKQEDITIAVLAAYDPRIKELLFIILTLGSKPSL